MNRYIIRKLTTTLFILLVCITWSNGQFSNDRTYMFRCSLRDKGGNLWFGTAGAGVYRYNATLNKFTHFTKDDGLNDNSVGCVFEDKAGNIWLGTGNGVSRYDGKLFTDMTAKEGLCKFDINCITEDKAGNIWIGSNGWGVCRLSSTTGNVTNFTKEEGLGSNAVQCILEDKAGNIWFGERAGGVSRFDGATGKFIKVGEACLSSQVMSIIEDKKGNIWFANLYTGLCRYDGKLYEHFNENNGLCNDSITCLYEDKKGNIWIGSDMSKFREGKGGICRYNGSATLSTGNAFVYFAIKENLSNMGVWCIVEDNDENLWVGTRKGLYRYHTPSGRFINYTHKVNN